MQYARSIFDSIKSYLSNNWQFWLQFGCLELEYGEIDLAENYLNQAYQLKPEADFVIHAMAHLWLKQAVNASNIGEAIMLRQKAEGILKKQFENDMLNDPYPYHILCYQLMAWTRAWVNSKDKKKKEYANILKLMKEARERFPLNERLEKLEFEIRKELLYTAVD
jgi:hypothetical protein